MPYTKPERREVVDSFKGEYGDLVYYYYKLLVESWIAYPSFGRYFQMRYLLRSGSYTSHTDADLQSTFIGREGIRVPAALETIRWAAGLAYDCAVDELKRRYVDKYEDAKMKENGDVQ